jgi:hypothetical protein
MGTRLTSCGATATCHGGNPTDPPGDVAPWDSEMAKSHGVTSLWDSNLEVFCGITYGYTVVIDISQIVIINY